MKTDEIIAMAREAEISLETMVLLCGVEIQVTASPLSVDELASFAALVAAKEREACAQVCDAKAHEVRLWCNESNVIACAAAIRARASKGEA